MRINIKPHSSLSKFFNGSDLFVEVSTYREMLEYFRSMHPRFMSYTKQIVGNKLRESYYILDENYKQISQNDLILKKATSKTIYIVPAIFGGGKVVRNAFLAIAAVALIIFAPAIGGWLAGTALGTSVGLTATYAATLVTTIGIGLGVAAITSMMMMDMEMPKGPDEENRINNNMFNSLANTIDTGVAIPLNYGMVRVAGHYVTGRLETVNHSRGAFVSLRSHYSLDSAVSTGSGLGRVVDRYS